MKVNVTKNVLYFGYSVRLNFEGKTFPTFFRGTKEEATTYANRIRKSINRSGTKKKALTAAAGL
jgi:hypothetical protein